MPTYPSCALARTVTAMWEWSGAGDAHEEVVAEPIGGVAVLAEESTQLGIVTDAVEDGVEEHRLAGGAGRAVGAGDEVDNLVPVEVGGGAMT